MEKGTTTDILNTKTMALDYKGLSWKYNTGDTRPGSVQNILAPDAYAFVDPLDSYDFEIRRSHERGSVENSTAGTEESNFLSLMNWLNSEVQTDLNSMFGAGFNGEVVARIDSILLDISNPYASNLTGVWRVTVSIGIKLGTP